MKKSKEKKWGRRLLVAMLTVGMMGLLAWITIPSFPLIAPWLTASARARYPIPFNASTNYYDGYLISLSDLRTRNGRLTYTVTLAHGSFDTIPFSQKFIPIDVVWSDAQGLPIAQESTLMFLPSEFNVGATGMHQSQETMSIPPNARFVTARHSLNQKFTTCPMSLP